jgi:hypothetical protein
MRDFIGHMGGTQGSEKAVEAAKQALAKFGGV